MDAIEQKLRNTKGLTDDIRADLWDLHHGNAETIKDPVLKALALLSKISPADRDLAEKYPTILKLLIGKGK